MFIFVKFCTMKDFSHKRMYQACRSNRIVAYSRRDQNIKVTCFVMSEYYKNKNKNKNKFKSS